MEQALNNWAEMYNKKDKEHFDCQLKLAKAENKLSDIQNVISNYIDMNSQELADAISIILQRK